MLLCISGNSLLAHKSVQSRIWIFFQLYRSMHVWSISHRYISSRLWFHGSIWHDTILFQSQSSCQSIYPHSDINIYSCLLIPTVDNNLKLSFLNQSRFWGFPLLDCRSWCQWTSQAAWSHPRWPERTSRPSSSSLLFVF